MKFPSAPPVALIVAMTPDRVIGRDNDLPWRLPEDLRHFKQMTLGKPIIMGRRTHESIGRPLPGRLNIVISRRPDYRAEGVTVVPTLAAALEKAARELADCGAPEIMVIGGAAIFSEALPLARRIYLTEVEERVAGDTYFPALEATEWREVERQSGAGCSFVLLERREVAEGERATSREGTT